MQDSDTITLSPKSCLQGEISVAPDKSISHRAIMCAALAFGKTRITNFLNGSDCLSTISCFNKLGVEIVANNNFIEVSGSDFNLKKPDKILDVGNSGTTLRLLSGILAGCNFDSVLDGDASIKKRPLKRVTEPLAKMGAKFELTNENFCPVKIIGGNLCGINYNTPIASAQVKSAIIFAALQASSKTVILEKAITRDHTERMLKMFGANIKTDKNMIEINPVKRLIATDIDIPSDISSAAYFIAAALITKNSEIKIKNVGLNPTRCYILKILERMNADITIENYKDGFEPTGDIIAKSSTLYGTVISGAEIPLIIDELPILAVIASQSHGQTIIKNAEELKFKESNRIDTVCSELKKCGVDIKKTDDGFIIESSKKINGALFDSYNDHRIAMMCAIISLVSTSVCSIKDFECTKVSFPGFFEILNNIGKTQR